MKFYCPYCTSEISPETNQCSSCCTKYGDDTVELIRIIFEKADQEYENERRKHIRVQKTFKVSYSSPKHFAESYIHDLSLGGVFVVTNDPLEPGELFDLKIFLLDEAESMEIPCQVMWARREEELTDEGEILPPGMGVEFVKLSTENTERLISVLKRSLEHSKC